MSDKIVIKRIKFSEESARSIAEKSYLEHRNNFIKALEDCNSKREIEMVLSASINIIAQKANSDLTNKLLNEL